MKKNLGTQPVNTVSITKYFNDTMYILSPYIRKSNTEVHITSSGKSVLPLSVINKY